MARKIGELHIGENASVSDIESMIDHGLETARGVVVSSNEDGTYDVLTGVQVCEFCGGTVEEPSHAVVNGRVFPDDGDTCAACGYSDAELLEWVEEHNPGVLSESEKADLRD